MKRGHRGSPSSSETPPAQRFKQNPEGDFNYSPFLLSNCFLYLYFWLI